MNWERYRSQRTIEDTVKLWELLSLQDEMKAIQNGENTWSGEWLVMPEYMSEKRVNKERNRIAWDIDHMVSRWELPSKTENNIQRKLNTLGAEERLEKERNIVRRSMELAKFLTDPLRSFLEENSDVSDLSISKSMCQISFIYLGTQYNLQLTGFSEYTFNEILDTNWKKISLHREEIEVFFQFVKWISWDYIDTLWRKIPRYELDRWDVDIELKESDEDLAKLFPNSNKYSYFIPQVFFDLIEASNIFTSLEVEDDTDEGDGSFFWRGL